MPRRRTFVLVGMGDNTSRHHRIVSVSLATATAIMTKARAGCVSYGCWKAELSVLHAGRSTIYLHDNATTAA